MAVCYELKKHFPQTMPKQRRSRAAPVLTLLSHTSWPGWVAPGFSRKCQEITSEWLMPHLLTRMHSFSTHTYRKLLSSSCHTLEAFLRETAQVLEERQQQRYFPKKMSPKISSIWVCLCSSPLTSHLSSTEIFSGNYTTTKCLHLTTTLTPCSRI